MMNSLLVAGGRGRRKEEQEQEERERERGLVLKFIIIQRNGVTTNPTTFTFISQLYTIYQTPTAAVLSIHLPS